MSAAIEIAKRIPLEQEIARRGLRLKRQGAELVGACPRCGGVDRFGINTRKQVFNCRGCGVGGDVIDLTRHLDGLSFRQAIETLTGDARSTAYTTSTAKPVAQEKVAHTETENGTRGLQLWAAARPIAGTLAEVYLHHRGLTCEDHDGRVLRFHGACPFGSSTHPCMLALFRDIHTDTPKAIHRIAIGPDETKIGKMMLGPVAGCAIKLSADEDVTYGLTVAEGVETAIAGMQLGFRPAWALGSAGAIRSFPVLAGIECLSILVDHDEADSNGRRAGQEAGLECARRWDSARREVHRIVAKRLGADMGDVAKERSQ